MEVRARIQQVVGEEAARYDLEAIRSKKNEIMKAVREDVVPFFKSKGIEITTIAMLGGLAYENAEIQKAIDDAVKTSQLKVAAESKREAREIENRTLRLAAEGKAEAAKLQAKGLAETEVAKAEADAQVRVRLAEAEADAMRKTADAKAYEVQKAGESPEVYLRLKALEAEIERWKRWDGRFPSTLTQVGDGKAGLLVTTPSAPPATPAAAARP